LWSWKLVPPLKKLISSSDLVHIHFARDLVPFLAAFLAIILHKPFITQTHGMIISDGRLSTRLIDWLLTRPLINRSSMNLVLSDYEADAVSKLRIRPPLSIVPNGIAQSLGSVKSRNSIKRIVFCSRLDKRKGVNKFIDIAEQFKESDLSFEIYGPDGGELNFVKSEIKRKNISNTLKYKGSLPSNEVQNMLQGVDLLILPSKDEPFPMVILESLAVGTQVLVMPSCGFAGQLRDFEDAFVAESEDQKGILNSFQKFFDSGFELKSREVIRAFCRDTFGISSVTDQLLQNYKKALFNE
jgi:glycosyltransferase involved in cell wall biosynthesis